MLILKYYKLFGAPTGCAERTSRSFPISLENLRMVSVSGQGVDLLVRGNSRPAGHCAAPPKVGIDPGGSPLTRPPGGQP